MSDPKLSWMIRRRKTARTSKPRMVNAAVLSEWADTAVELESECRKWELEAHRLYGVDQDIEEMRAALEAKLSKMEKALDDIARGDAHPPDDVLDDKATLTSYMWTYSQKRAREALAGGDDV